MKKQSEKRIRSEHQARFIKLLEQLGVTEKQVVDKCEGISQATLNKYINGQTESPSIDFVIAFSSAYAEVSLNYWLLGKGIMFSMLRPNEILALNEPDNPNYFKLGEANVLSQLLKNQEIELDILVNLQKKLLE